MGVERVGPPYWLAMDDSDRGPEGVDPLPPSIEDPTSRIREELALWASPPMADVRHAIAEAARIDVPVLLTGETGTGKELAARAIHHLGVRAHAPFAKVNCTAAARDTLEAELFGHERGAFPGARQPKVGKLESADGGTILLDEIGDLHPGLQAKLLHVLEEGQLSRVGSWSTTNVDVRVLATTNRSLEDLIEAGRFREDLFYRLNVIRIVVPPLRHHLEDLPALAEYFVRRHCQLLQCEPFTLPPETLERLKRHSFPGNVRELENLIKRMVVLRDANRDRHPSQSSTRPAPRSLRAISREAAQIAEHVAIRKALEATRWNRLRAAKLLNVSYRSLLSKIKAAGLDGATSEPLLPWDGYTPGIKGHPGHD